MATNMNMTDALYLEAMRSLITPLRSLFHDLLNEAGIGMSTVPAKLLYHYTTADGLKGIVTKKQIWATNTDYLNDTSEIAHGKKLTVNALEVICVDPNNVLRGSDASVLVETGQQEAQTKTMEVMTKLLTSLKTEKIRDYYLVSFCESGNLLSQWRGYGNYGGGYAIGFTIKEPEASSHKSFKLLKVLYDREQQQTLIEKLTRGVSDILVDHFNTSESTMKSIEERPDSESILEAANVVLRYSLIQLKSPGFSEEREWRLCFDSPERQIEDVEFRTANGILVPYIEKPIAELGMEIESVCCGPTLHPEISVQSVKMLLAKNEMKEVQVHPSGITLRS